VLSSVAQHISGCLCTITTSTPREAEQACVLGQPKEWQRDVNGPTAPAASAAAAHATLLQQAICYKPAACCTVLQQHQLQLLPDACLFHQQNNHSLPETY
jgi:hypothetical protein